MLLLIDVIPECARKPGAKVDSANSKSHFALVGVVDIGNSKQSPLLNIIHGIE